MVLTAKQQAFVKHYLVSLNASKSCIEAGYSPKYANRQAAALLAKPHIQEAIREEMAKRCERVEVTQDQVVAELAKVAFGDPRAVMEWGPEGVTMKASSELNDTDAAQVAEVSESVTKEGGSQRIKLHDKLKALELLGKHLGMFVDKKELSGPNGAPLEPTTIKVVFTDDPEDN